MSSNCNGGGITMECGSGSKSLLNLQGLKKGPWTAAEDAILMEYVKKHGEGNWNSVQKNSGLMRCGKSCRLRWANHLRPNLKKGSFTPEEERIIIDLHSKLGNKWARMASQLPGRTDNEIKNFWNTRMKRRQRAGLPIYPQEFHEESTTIQHHHHNHQDLHKQKHPNSSPFSSFVSSRKTAAYNNHSLPFLDSITFSAAFDPLQNHFNNSFYSNPTLHFKSLAEVDHNNNNTYTNNTILPLSPVPHQYPTTSPQLSSFNQNFADHSIPTTPPPLMHYPNANFENNMSFTSLIIGDQEDQQKTGYIPELPSNQIPPGPNTPFSSSTSHGGGVCLQAEIENETKECNLENRSSGLLDALLMESKNLLRKEKLNNDEDLVGMLDKGKRKMEERSDKKAEEEEEQEEDDDEQNEEEKEGRKRAKLSSANSGVASATNHCCDDISSSQSSIGMKPSEEAMEEMNSMDDDLLSLLDNFPSTTPPPEWYRTRNVSEGMLSGTAGDGQEGQEVEAQEDNSPRRPDSRNETSNVEWGLGSSYWNNMTSIC